MEPTGKLKVITERNFSAHHLLIGAAYSVLGTQKTEPPGRPYNELIVITLCALSVEALCNAVGAAVIPNWKVRESLSPIEKLSLLCEHLKAEYDKGKDPWASARWLYRVRNLIAHAKPEFVQERKVVSRDDYDRGITAFPKSRLEKEITFDNAHRALRTAEDIKDLLCSKLPPEKWFGLTLDSSSGRVSAHSNVSQRGVRSKAVPRR